MSMVSENTGPFGDATAEFIGAKRLRRGLPSRFTLQPLREV